MLPRFPRTYTLLNTLLHPLANPACSSAHALEKECHISTLTTTNLTDAHSVQTLNRPLNASVAAISTNNGPQGWRRCVTPPISHAYSARPEHPLARPLLCICALSNPAKIIQKTNRRRERRRRLLWEEGCRGALQPLVFPSYTTTSRRLPNKSTTTITLTHYPLLLRPTLCVRQGTTTSEREKRVLSGGGGGGVLMSWRLGRGRLQRLVSGLSNWQYRRSTPAEHITPLQ